MAERWDIFCRVVDNWGDIGVCWRLASALAGEGLQVRLWIDDASALTWMAPAGCPGVQVCPWPAAAPADGPAQVVLETFGCELPPAYVGAMAAMARPPVWVNLEYLSAEDYVQRSHRLPSPIFSGPGAGLTRWYFYPGFSVHTGGLLRERDLRQRQQAFERSAWRRRHGIAEGQMAVSLFCYEPPALGAWLQTLAGSGRAHLLLTPGRASAAFARSQAGQSARPDGQLAVTHLPTCSQSEFDELLWASDFNCVRGEDSLVRALWAGKPLLWQIYPQDDGAHHAKLDAFLDWLQAPASLRRLHHAWNGMAAPASLPSPGDAVLYREWSDCVLRARERLWAQPDLLSELRRFVDEKS
ncbi:elongation factor P maturation arginine rhamnosyltransferase EarP [Comamonas sp. NLF-1-9]|uniref:elongation factor P maturation arginine rhamnosyltransferase EarP n=1 Tax=Comamonas sp. NLF-1-9 TaxID=2853163 RepID=UPI001C4547DB|nr:elongation factor P maturation arginine rhamnosyltransferase EarP [Comamonas sp. NLF-1-9]QXL85651.1 elongation factor P maturation arginine rhamnosyltransferase EarP [Comamonas sp. NLF-1-9]